MQALFGIGFVVAFIAINVAAIFVATVRRDGWQGFKVWWLS